MPTPCRCLHEDAAAVLCILHELNGGCVQIAVEAISNIYTVASLCGEQLFLDRYLVELRLARQAARRKTGLRGAVFSLGQTSWFFGYGLSLYYGGYLVATEGLPYKDVIK